MSEQVTRTLARYVVEARASELPERVAHEASRSLLNWIGCAVGAARHETLERAIAALKPFWGPPQAAILGRSERCDVLHAALYNGLSSHTFDFDDTHLRTVIHPSGPVAAALLSLAQTRIISGRDFAHAFALGVEVECRIGNAVYPSHYDVGWHITGTAGVFGAAAAVGRVLALDEQHMTWALGTAATQAAGLREMFGSMCKPLHPGMAARNGMSAALLAAQGFTSSEFGIEGRRGFANVLASARDYSRITEGLGASWQLLENTYKPFACGIVIHPVIDGCIQLRNQHGLVAGEIRAIRLRVHPLVLELTGKKTPRVGLEGKFSVYHSAAVAIIDGAAGQEHYSDARVADPMVVALRERVSATVDTSLHEDAARVEIEKNDGTLLECHVLHAVGSLARPMSDGDLENKFRGLCAPILPAGQIARLIEACWNLAREDDGAVLARLAAADGGAIAQGPRS